MKIVQALEASIILLKGVTKNIENEAKEQKGEFIEISALEADLFGNKFAGKGIVRAGYGNKKGKKNIKSRLWKL